jgi:hypothetical protein
MVVANIGAAIANTGLNQIAGGTASGSGTPLDPATAQLVDALAAYLADVLVQMNGLAASTAAGTSHSGIALPHGDLIIGVDSTLTGNVFDAGASSANPSARVRQLTAVISLGVSSANTGKNTTITVVVGSRDDASGANAVTLKTGDALATNASLVIICQLDDSPDHRCLMPPVVEPSMPGRPGEQGQSAVEGPAAVPSGQPGAARDARASSPPSAVGADSGVGATGQVAGQVGGESSDATLPATGADLRRLLTIGIMLLTAGGVLCCLRRRSPA